MLEQAAVRGTLRLAPAGSDWRYDYYKVSDVNWTVAFGNSELRITGSGTYTIGGEFALVHRRELDLAVGDNPVQHFDSGRIPVSAAFPAIDVAVSLHGQYCFDTVIHVVTTPVPLDQIHLYRLLSDTTFQRGCFGLCDCLLGEEQPVAGTFLLVDLDETPKFREFAIVDVRWSVGAAAGTTLARTPIRGFGMYRIGVESAWLHRLALDLFVGREPLTHYDSGLVAPTTRFPRIDADISIGGLTCYDTLIRVHAGPRRKARPRGRWSRWSSESRGHPGRERPGLGSELAVLRLHRDRRRPDRPSSGAGPDPERVSRLAADRAAGDRRQRPRRRPRPDLRRNAGEGSLLP
ncbi:MAG: hypothetical protein AAB249_00205, partial [Acidobacteriota bacterium]